MVGILRSRRGFTLLEMLIASTLTTLIVILVSSVFLVQNRFYRDIQRRTAVHEAVRSVTEMLSGEVREIPKNGFVSAQYDRLIYRTPVAIGGVCDLSGGDIYIHIPLSGTAFDSPHSPGSKDTVSAGSPDLDFAQKRTFQMPLVSP